MGGTMRIFFSVVLISFSVFCPVFSADNAGIPVSGANSGDFARGEELFLHNKPNEALPFLEKAFVANQDHLEGALYLAMCYEQLGKFDEAITIYRKILPAGEAKTALIACNLGNIYFKKGSNTLAEQFYTHAIRSDPAYASAWLNRANVRVKTGSLRDAVSDYDRYLSLEPASPKRPQIEKLVSLIVVRW